jgi:hypothetical protein
VNVTVTRIGWFVTETVRLKFLVRDELSLENPNAPGTSNPNKPRASDVVFGVMTDSGATGSPCRV